MATGFDGEFAGSDRFELIRRLGAGGMGVVYQAYDRKRSCTVALKTLRHRDATALYQLKREFRELADISHPNLAALHELVSSGDEWFFTMELVEGVDFVTWVRGGPEPGFRSLGLDDTEPYRRPDTGSGSLVSRFSTQTRPGTDATPVPLDQPTPSPPLSYDGLRDALRQLAEGVHVLHQAGKLHRDIKPSNVMVDRNGRVVLLDFGLITDLARPGGGVSDDYNVVGTVDYMSPEQGASLQLGPASDWYAVGTVLYDALTGTLPFVGPPIMVLMEKQRREPVPPLDLVPETPVDLSQLCVDLLHRDPAARPDGEAILRRLGSSLAAPSIPGRPPRPRSQDAAPLVGRSPHAQVLREAFSSAVSHGQAVTVLVYGRSGMGKSMLIERVTRELAQERGAVVLAGRCYERESVPYKALDSLVDALSRHLARLSREEVEALLPRDVLSVTRLFPVLRRSEVVKAAPQRIAAADPHELRRRGLDALRELLARMAARHPLVLVIDDVQWGDLDSSMLLIDLLRAPDAPALLLVLAYRSEDADTSEAVRHLVEGLRAPRPAAVEVREVEVGILAPDEARELALIRLGRDGASSRALATAIARESAGDPFLIDQLVRFLHAADEPLADVSFGDVMRVRLAQIGPEARRVLELVAIAGRPLPESLVTRAAGLARVDQTMAVLRAGSLIRTSGSPELTRIEAYHDRIREAVIATLDDAQQRDCHLALADALESSWRPDPEALAVHLLGGGATQRGVGYAIEAAEKASAALAFERAAVFYRLAIDALSPEEVVRRRLRAQLGDALVNAGRCVDAAAEFLETAERIPDPEALELRRRAAEQLLRCGHVDDGLRELDTVLHAIGMRLAPTPARAMWSFLRQRVRARLRGLRYTEREANEVSAESLTRIDVCWTAATGMGLMDPIRGLDFQTRHLLLALGAGEPYRVARALAVEACFSAVGGRANWKRTARLIGMAGRLADRIAEPHARGLVAFARGLAAYQTRQWSAALRGFDDAAEILRADCTGVADQIAVALRYAADVLFQLGRMAELCRRVPHYLAEAERRGDLYGANGMRSGLPNAVWLAADDPATALVESEHGAECLSRRLGFTSEHFFQLIARTHIALYTGEGGAAYRRIVERWPALKRSKLQRLQSIRADALFLRGRAALAAAAEAREDSAERQGLLADLERTRRQLQRQDVPGARAEAGTLLAGAAWLAGDAELAAQLLNQVEWQFMAAEMELAADAARYRRGQLTGGVAGQQLMEESEQRMGGEGIRNPAAMARMLTFG